MKMKSWNEPTLWGALDEIHKMYFAFPSEGEAYNGYLILKHCVLFSMVSWFFFYGIFGFMLKANSDGLRKEIADSLHAIVTGCILLFFILTFLIVGNRVRALLDKMNRMTREIPAKISRANLLVNRSTWIMFYFSMTIGIPLAIFVFYFNMHCEARELKGDKRYVCGQLHYAWYPFETDSRWKEFLIAASVAGCNAILLPLCCSTLVSCYGIPYVLTIRLQDLREQIEKIDTRNLQLFDEMFVHLVEYYSEIYGCVKAMNDSIGYCLFSINALITLLIAIMEYVTIIEGNYENLLMLVGCLSMEYVLCRTGQNLEDEHEKLVQSIANLPWYKMPLKMRRNYRLFLGQVQVPIHFKKKPLLDINNEDLMSTLQASYSLATFLMNSTRRE